MWKPQQKTQRFDSRLADGFSSALLLPLYLPCRRTPGTPNCRYRHPVARTPPASDRCAASCEKYTGVSKTLKKGWRFGVPERPDQCLRPVPAHRSTIWRLNGGIWIPSMSWDVPTHFFTSVEDRSSKRLCENQIRSLQRKNYLIFRPFQSGMGP